MRQINEQTVADRLIEHFGNISATAKAFGKYRQEIQQWRDAGKIPFKKGIQVEELTGGAITRFEVWEAASK